MAVKFLVEHIIKEKGQKPYIIARHLIAGQNFSIAEKSFLNGIEIEPSLTSPRAVSFPKVQPVHLELTRMYC